MTDIKYHVSGIGKNMYVTATMTSEVGSTFSMSTRGIPQDIVEKFVDSNTEYKTRQGKLMDLALRSLHIYLIDKYGRFEDFWKIS